MATAPTMTCPACGKQVGLFGNPPSYGRHKDASGGYCINSKSVVKYADRTGVARGLAKDRRARMHDAIDKIFDRKATRNASPALVDKVAKAMDPEKYTWSPSDAAEVRERAKGVVKLARAGDVAPFDRDTDKGAERIVKRESRAGKTAKQIAKEYGFSLSFVEEAMGVQPIGDEGAHVGMFNVNADKAKALAKTLERKGFQYRFPATPPTTEMAHHAFVKRGEYDKNEWKILNERKNGYHNVTDL